MAAGRLPPLDVHAHVDDVGAGPIAPGARVFGQTMTPSEWDTVQGRRSDERVVWGLGLHPIYIGSARDLDEFVARLPHSSSIGEIGLDNTGLSPVPATEQRRILSEILSHPAASERLVSLHALLAYGDVVSILSDHPIPGAILHWWSAPGKTLAKAVELGAFFSVNDAVAADPEQAKVLPELPPERTLVETDAPYIDRHTGAPLNPWEDTEARRAAGRSLRSGEVTAIEKTLASVWQTDPEAVRLQIWRNLAELESRVKVRPFDARSVLALSGFDPE